MTTAPPVEPDEGNVVNLMDALRPSLAGQRGGSKEGAERFFERNKGKDGAKAKGKKTTRAA